MYTLETKNLPILSTLQGWKYGFSSPFEAEVYFLNTKRFTDLKWGTMNPVMLRDPEFGPVRLRAFGTYAIRVKDPAAFIREIAGTDGRFTTDEITDQLRNLIVTSFAGAVATSGIPVLDLSANYGKVGQVIRDAIQPEFDAYGLEVATLLVENVSLPRRWSRRWTAAAAWAWSAISAATPSSRPPRRSRPRPRIPAGPPASASAWRPPGARLRHGRRGAAGRPGAGRRFGAAALARRLSCRRRRQAGRPFPAAELRGMVRDGRLSRDSLVWTQGMAGWSKAGEVAGLAALFADQPPPLPPA